MDPYDPLRSSSNSNIEIEIIKLKKRIVILGAGESGTGTAILAQQKGYDVFVTDAGSIKENYRDDLVNNGIEFEEGKHSEEKIMNADVVMKSPGIPEKAEMVKNNIRKEK